MWTRERIYGRLVSFCMNCWPARHPSTAAPSPKSAVRVTTQPPPPLNAYRSDIPEGLEAIINQCLQKERSGRYANIADLAMALAPFGPRRSRDAAERISRVLHEAGLSGTAMTFPPSSQQPAQKHAADTMGGLGYTSAGSKRRRLVKWSIAVGIIAVAAAVGAAAMLKKLTGATGSGLASIAPAASAVPQLENSISVAATAAPIAQVPDRSATDKALRITSGQQTSTGASVQAKVVTSNSSRALAKQAPITKATASGTGMESSNAANVARHSQLAPQIDTAPAASSVRRTVTKPAPSNNLGGRL